MSENPSTRTDEEVISELKDSLIKKNGEILELRLKLKVADEMVLKTQYEFDHLEIRTNKIINDLEEEIKTFKRLFFIMESLCQSPGKHQQ